MDSSMCGHRNSCDSLFGSTIVRNCWWQVLNMSIIPNVENKDSFLIK